MNPEEYNAMYRIEQDHWWYRGLRDIFFPWVRRLKPKDIFDAGCGTGLNLALLQDQGYSTSGIDASDLAIELSQKRGVRNISVGFIQKLPLTDASSDLICSLDVLGLLNDEDADLSLREFYRCLRPGGSLILNVAALQWLYSTHDQACHLQRRFSRRELIERLKACGFTITFVTYRVFLLFPLVALFKLLEKRQMHQDIQESQGDLEKTSPLLNALLFPVMKLENWLLRFVSLPWGSSLFVVARKKG